MWGMYIVFIFFKLFVGNRFPFLNFVHFLNTDICIKVVNTIVLEYSSLAKHDLTAQKDQHNNSSALSNKLP